jgi:hypothetical protein
VLYLLSQSRGGVSIIAFVPHRCQSGEHLLVVRGHATVEALSTARHIAERLGSRLVVARDRVSVCPACGSADELAGDAVMRVVDALFAAEAVV